MLETFRNITSDEKTVKMVSRRRKTQAAVNLKTTDNEPHKLVEVQQKKLALLSSLLKVDHIDKELSSP